MTTAELRPTDVGTSEDDDLPIGHLPDAESWRAVQSGERPTRALCGAPLLGIPTGDTPFRRCDECDRLWEESCNLN